MEEALECMGQAFEALETLGEALEATELDEIAGQIDEAANK
jgi:hypothetical protein